MADTTREETVGIDFAYSDDSILIDLHNLGFHGDSLGHLEKLESYIQSEITKAQEQLLDELETIQDSAEHGHYSWTVAEWVKTKREQIKDDKV